jgi:S-adenosylmethionine:tRNA ribosyltransferase-isomerase
MAGQAMQRDLTVSDFDFELPPELIAQRPLAERAASRLLHVRPDGLDDRRFIDLAGLLDAGDVLVINDTRVIKARLMGSKASGGRVEALIERMLPPRRALALLRASHPPRPGTRLRFSAPPLSRHALRAACQPAAEGPGVRASAEAVHAEAEVLRREDDLFELVFDSDVAPLLERLGQVPLPPYVARPPDHDDEARYQTVFARENGAVAAPTAGLHLTEALLARMRARGIAVAPLTLHVGAGTFQPVRVERIAEHRMHAERYAIPEATAAAVNAARAAGRRVAAVGTPSLRALESGARDGGDGQVKAGSGETRLFITPGYRFQVVDRLVTNFHLPRSTLLMLVSAFAGIERIRAAYAHAVRERYRFFSYGDAMLLERAP